MEPEIRSSTYIPPVKTVSKELTSNEVEQYFVDLWKKLDSDYAKDFKRGMLVSKSQAGKSTDAEKTMRAIFSLYLYSIKEKINELDSERDKEIFSKQVHELDKVIDSLLQMSSALDLNIDRKDLLPSLNGYILETTSRIKL